ncbi:MAG: EscF/YscF/HrpA family type III secretion system needle major subunit [Thermodesulforhabdaceae bacterium]
MGISLDSLYGKMSDFVGKAESNLETHMNTMDPNDSADMLKLQMLTQKWTMATNLSTNMMNTLKEMTKEVVQNIR